MIVFGIPDGLLLIYERQSDQANDEEENEREDRRAQAPKYLIHQAKKEGTDPRRTAVADLIERVEFSFPAGGDHLCKKAAAYSLRSTKHKRNNDTQKHELYHAVITSQTVISIDHDRRQDDQADNDRSFGANPLRQATPKQGAEEGRKLDDQNNDG